MTARCDDAEFFSEKPIKDRVTRGLAEKLFPPLTFY